MNLVAAFASLVLLLGATTIHANESVVTAKPTGNVPLNVGTVCLADVCHAGWVRWTFTVSKTLLGPKISGAVSAVREQGGQFRVDGNESEKRIRANEDFVFVLRPIADPELREKLQAEYYIPDMSKPILIYCLREKPSDFEVFTDSIADLKYPGVPSYCFQLPTWEVHGI